MHFQRGADNVYKFCKANGGWWFVCRSIEELFDFKDKNSNKFALKITFS